MEQKSYFQKYRPVTEAMPELNRENMQAFLIGEDPKAGLQEFYSAHTDYMDPEAKVVFIGVCPGFEQMKLSFDIVKNGEGQPEADVLQAAKRHARFGRSMRRNLIELADQTILPERLHLHSCKELFDLDCHLMDNTCLLPYPIFRNGKNYTGHAPKTTSNAFLSDICQTQLEKIARTYPEAVFIPLGKSVDETIRKSGLLPESRIIHGFPHPSGVNGHRFRQLEENLPAINKKLATVFPEAEQQ